MRCSLFGAISLILMGLTSVVFVEKAVAQTAVSSDLIEVDFVRAVKAIWDDDGSGANEDVSFWRPTPEFGFHAVGDHAKRGYDGPSVGIMVVREIQPGILAVPTGYSLIWTDEGSGADDDGSLWQPNCPPGYSALGHVANIGHQAPDVNEIRCVSDKVLVDGDPGGFLWDDKGAGSDDDVSVWSIRARIDDQEAYYRSSGLFYAGIGYGRPNVALKAIKVSKPAVTPTAQNQSGTSSPAPQNGSIKLSNEDLEFDFTANYDLVWDDKGSGANDNVSIHRPVPRDGFFALGHFMHNSYDLPTDDDMMMVVREKEAGSGALVAPLNYTPVWNDEGSGANQDVTIWKPACPRQYVALGMVASDGTVPSPDEVRCVRDRLTVIAGLKRAAPTEKGKEGDIVAIWTDQGSGAERDFAAYGVQPNTAPAGEAFMTPGSFVAVASYDSGMALGEARALKMKLPKIEPNQSLAKPVLRGFGAPSKYEQMTTTTEILLPFTAVIDPSWSQARMALESPVYRLVRSDRYKLKFHYDNSGGSIRNSREVRITSSVTNSESFANETGVSLTVGYDTGGGKLSGPSTNVSVTVHNNFTYTSTESSTDSETDVLPLNVPPGKAGALFVVESTFQLKRADGSPVGTTQPTQENPRSVVIAEYPPANDNANTGIVNASPGVNISTDLVLPNRQPRTVAPDNSQISNLGPAPGSQPNYRPEILAYMDNLRQQGMDEAQVQQSGQKESEAWQRVDRTYESLPQDWQRWIDGLWDAGELFPSQIEQTVLAELNKAQDQPSVGNQVSGDSWLNTLPQEWQDWARQLFEEGYDALQVEEIVRDEWRSQGGN